MENSIYAVCNALYMPFSLFSLVSLVSIFFYFLLFACWINYCQFALEFHINSRSWPSAEYTPRARGCIHEMLSQEGAKKKWMKNVKFYTFFFLFFCNEGNIVQSIYYIVRGRVSNENNNCASRWVKVELMQYTGTEEKLDCAHWL